VDDPLPSPPAHGVGDANRKALLASTPLPKIHCRRIPAYILVTQAWVMGNRTEVLALPPTMVAGYLKQGGSVVGTNYSDPQVVNFFDYPVWADIKDQ
jgi:hypothetical protein